MQEYLKILEEAEEKVDLANQIYDLVERYLKRLDSELQKFKIELEVDNSGITEILERSMLKLSRPNTAIAPRPQPLYQSRSRFQAYINDFHLFRISRA